MAVRERDSASGVFATKYQHTDALGSPVAVTDQARTVLERREYEPYGRQLRPTAPVEGPGYTGHVLDAATGLIYMQQRYYDPGIGRFLSVDPVSVDGNTGVNFNRYWYASDNPYRFTDRDGRCGGWFCEFFGLRGTPEAIRDKTFDQADAARGHTGKVIVGGYVASGVLAVGGVAVVESGVVVGAEALLARGLTYAGAQYTSLGIATLRIGQASADKATQLGNSLIAKANEATTSFLTSQFVTSGGNFSVFGQQANAPQIAQGVFNGLNGTPSELPTSPSFLFGQAVAEAAKIWASPPRPQPQLEDADKEYRDINK